MASWTFRAASRWISRHPEAQIARYVGELAAATQAGKSRRAAIAGPTDSARNREQVDRMIDGGMTFGQVENAIEKLDLPDHQKSALWMLAWSRLGAHGQELIAEGTWGAVAGP